MEWRTARVTTPPVTPYDTPARQPITVLRSGRQFCGAAGASRSGARCAKYCACRELRSSRGGGFDGARLAQHKVKLGGQMSVRLIAGVVVLALCAGVPQDADASDKSDKKGKKHAKHGHAQASDRDAAHAVVDVQFGPVDICRPAGARSSNRSPRRSTTGCVRCRADIAAACSTATPSSTIRGRTSSSTSRCCFDQRIPSPPRAVAGGQRA
jgi:hypothetical protein